MFRVKESDDPPGYSVAAATVLSALLLSLLVNISCAYLVVREYRVLSDWKSDPDAPAPQAIESLQTDRGLLIILTLATATTLVLSALAHCWLWRRYLTDRQSLRQVKRLAHNILANMDQGVITIDQQGCITSINTAASLLMDVDFECVGRPMASIESPELYLTGLSSQLAKKHGPVRDRDFTVHRNGRTQRVRGDAHVLTDTDGQPLGCVIHLRDVTERMLMEERMSRMERFITLGSLASGLHHEIKNPLTALSIHVQLLEERLRDPTSAEPVDELIGVLKTEVHRLNGVLESFRNFANLQRLTIQPTDVLDVLENVIRLLRPQAMQQQVHISLHHPNNELPRVPLDPEKFEQAVLNLVINSLEAMPTGGNLSLSATLRDGSLCVEIADTGAGIPEDIQPSVFKPYFSTKGKGTGMGLALTEKLVSQHGGHIDFQTSPGGTTFRLSLPLEQGIEIQ